MEELKMSRKSQKAWGLLTWFNNKPAKGPNHANSSATQIVQQFLINHRSEHRHRKLELKKLGNEKPISLQDSVA